MKAHIYDSHGEMDKLKQYFQAEDILFMDVKNQYKENPNYPPPNFSFKEWSVFVALAFASANFMKGHVQNLYIRCVLSIYEKEKIIPNFKEMEKWLLSFKGSSNLERETKARLINILQPMNLTLSSLLHCRKGHPYENILLDKNICFDISKLKREDKIFFITVHLLRAYLYRQSQGIRDRKSVV